MRDGSEHFVKKRDTYASRSRSRSRSLDRSLYLQARAERQEYFNSIGAADSTTGTKNVTPSYYLVSPLAMIDEYMHMYVLLSKDLN